MTFQYSVAMPVIQTNNLLIVGITCDNVAVATPVHQIKDDASMSEISVKKSVRYISSNHITDTAPFAERLLFQTYKAKWQRREVVIKVAKVTEADEHGVQYEANLTRRLNHPNVIELLGTTSVKHKQLGVVIEYADDGSLEKWIGKIDQEQQLQNIALGIISGLEYLHSKDVKVIHGNIKPTNILMFNDRRSDVIIPKIADFGKSTYEGKCRSTANVGEQLYMAPEVRLNLAYSFTADIFSLAMTMFEMFNEELVLKSSDEVKRFILDVHTGRIAEMPNSWKVPQRLRNVIESGWNENPVKRPELSQFENALKGYFQQNMFVD